MAFTLLPTIRSPRDLKTLNDDQLRTLTDEIREALCSVVQDRTAHFASNLGVVELCLALHLVFDFSKDRLIWDTGHQIYPHKLLTGRFDQFLSIRRRGGLMGFPNPAESDYDLFMTGHAGCSLSTVLGLKTADDLLDQSDRRAVAVIGDGALPSGIVFEAMNNAAELNKDMLVVLNDNKMGICPRVGGLAQYLDKARVAPFYNGLKRDVSWLLNRLPLVGDAAHQTLSQLKDAVKGFLHGGMLFEELGFRYVGPVDGHDLNALRSTLEMIKDVRGPVLLHVFTQKGHGFEPACQDPVLFHAPPPFARDPLTQAIIVNKGGGRTYTNAVSESLYEAMAANEKVCVLTAAMCEGNKLARLRTEFPTRFFDTGICESHTVAFAAGMAKAGMRPVVDIYSTFLQRSFDQIFQEVALQNLPVTFCLDRGGLAGTDGPTHHGVFDVGYLRMFPNMVVASPGDASDVGPMLEFALASPAPVAVRYPKASADEVSRDVQPVIHGRAEVYSTGRDGTFIAFGPLFVECVQAAAKLRLEGYEFGVINARFAKPLDLETLFATADQSRCLITVEENALATGFGSAVLEAFAASGRVGTRIVCLGIPDRFIEHGERDELLRELGLDANGLTQAGRKAVLDDPGSRHNLPNYGEDGTADAESLAIAPTSDADI